ncbi:MAG: gliding motility-associated C-terminal domain-containing protein [Bacteroidetes bacterium]|nr:gliding motility-associated C-terminal domain-containing protein [Bacteroidota bacterium]
MQKTAFLLFAFLVFGPAIWAQPSNDECTNPIVLPEVENYCSNPGEFTNVGASASAYGIPPCFINSQKDVWFAFTAKYTDITITVRGQTGGGGTLKNPQVALYAGLCGGTIEELECQSALGANNIVEAYQGGLFPGTTYLIRIQGRSGATGTFQICLNNYNPPEEPTSDCPSASVLCDKSAFVVQKVTGAGADIKELNDASCFFNGQGTNYETNSTWFVWTCAQSGSLEFALTPLNPTDDLDFVMYRLPNGIGNCNGKEVVRCMASGESPLINSSACLGPTGLRPGENDTSEDAGCSDSGDNAWLAPFNMVAGETYALCVNNFSTTGNGFSVKFGGSGTFLGPEAAFTTIPSAVCIGTPVQIKDASTSPFGNITNWAWSFGYLAQPQTANSQGPHTVQFNSPGQQQVVLSITAVTPQGRTCKITDIQQVTVYPDVKLDTLIAMPECNGGTNGAIRVKNIKDGTPPYLFSWNGGPFTSSDSLTGIPVGNYSLVVKDANNCETDVNVRVDEKALKVNADIQKPLCFGDANGIITLQVTNGTAPFLFNWGSGFIPNNSNGGYKSGIYTIQGLDAELCKGTYVVTVTDNPPLTLKIDTIDVSCYGANNGMAIANAEGGVEGFKYIWSDGQTDRKANNFPPGQYGVTVQDANNCIISGSVFIEEPEDLNIMLLNVVDLICFGEPIGQIRVQGSGGVPPYRFSPDGRTYTTSDTLKELGAGNYWVKIKDLNGCTDSVFAKIVQPPQLLVIAQPQDTTLNLGYSFDITTNTFPNGRPVDYSWTPSLGLDCTNCPNPYATAIQDIAYIIKVTDETNCMAFDTVLVHVNKKRPVYFPNILDPDKNYPNATFTGFANPAAQQIDLLRIYDRWGELIFETKNIPLNDPNLGWDGYYKGKPMNGVFAYYALVRFVDEEVLQYEGNVTVFR